MLIFLKLKYFQFYVLCHLYGKYRHTHYTPHIFWYNVYMLRYGFNSDGYDVVFERLKKRLKITVGMLNYAELYYYAIDH